jgi:uncharacterized protein (TIGR02453 family)
MTSKSMPAGLRPETFRFLRGLARNNRKAWMDTNRERYQVQVVAPMRGLVEALGPSLIELDPGFDVGPRTGRTLSRINRDVRFASDKSPYRSRLYLQFSHAGAGARAGQLFIGVGPGDLSVGFRIYRGADSPLESLGRVRALDNPEWLARQARRLGRRYESYWYATSRWTRHSGFPTRPEHWQRLQGWVVRRGYTPAAATRPAFTANVRKVFRELFPLYAFTSLEG